MILIVDFGSQTCHLIGRRLRDIGVTTTIIDPETALEEVKKHMPHGIIFSGGPASVFEKGAPTIDKKIFTLGIPILGICYGWQLTAHLLGGKVVSGHKEYGPAHLTINEHGRLLAGIESYSKVWVSHGTTVVRQPKEFHILGQTETVKYAAVADPERNIYGVQFHPEAEHTVHGTTILANFAQNICKIRPKKHTLSIKTLVDSIRKEVGKANVICAVSGGVDSTVTAALIGKAVGRQLIPVYVESGLMRSGTREEVETIFRKHLDIKPIIINAEKLFLSQLKGLIHAEDKRKTIGRLYIELFEKEVKKHLNVLFLAQGTIYSDVIESKGTKNADKIKSHHNVGGLPDRMKLSLIEPLRSFYKDEVRLIGKKLGLPPVVVGKQVFPGPGQAIRIVGEVTKERLERQQLADTIVIDEIRKAGLYEKVYMSFPIMTNTVSTAVKGDARELLEVVGLRIIESSDIMTTDWAKIPYEILQKISSRIVNEVPGVSRVVYDITTKPPATMEWE